MVITYEYVDVIWKLARIEHRGWNEPNGILQKGDGP